ncbi:MAG: aminotransferase class V-fold PLP-dependent enzyme, partial [Oscillospiraceae bacterium]
MIYLDSAATTLQKPAAVSNAMRSAMARMATPGRGGHRPAALAAETAFACREKAAELFGVDAPEHVVFTFNATHALNIAIKTLVKPGSTVLISGYEHNAVTRTLAAIKNVKIRVAGSPLFRSDQLLSRFEELMTNEVGTVVCNHVSNVFGYVLPIPEIAALCRARKIPLIVDASQSAGCLPVSLKEWGAAFIAMPGHKGLYGPQGTGLLLCASDTVQPLIEGGTGSTSARQEMPDFLPDRLEAGT